MIPVVETARVRLRAFREDDFEAIYAGLCDPAVTVFLGPQTREQAWEKALRNMGQWVVDGFGMFLVAERATDAPLGQAGLGRFRRQLGPAFDDAPESAWVLSARRGEGLATEAAVAALTWLEGVRGPERTVCLIDPDNAPSLRVAAKLGYTAFATVDYKGKPALTLERTAEAGAGAGHSPPPPNRSC